MDDERCETCRFWEGGDGEGTGPCRRNAPPVRLGLDDDGERFGHAEFAYWPITLTDDWCGEHQPRKPLPVVAPLSQESFSIVCDSAAERVLNGWQWPSTTNPQVSTKSRRRVRSYLMKDYVAASRAMAVLHPGDDWSSRPAPPESANVIASIQSANLADVVRSVIRDSPKTHRAAYLRAVLAANGHPEA